MAMAMANIMAILMVNVMAMVMVIAYIVVQGDKPTSGEVENQSKADPAGVSILCVQMVFPLPIKL